LLVLLLFVNDEVRPGLQSICQDSEWKKNFTKFL